MQFYQHTVTVQEHPRGCHLVTDRVIDKDVLRSVSKLQVGLIHVFLQHTSASLFIGENADRSVRTDMDRAIEKMVPETMVEWRHGSEEGPDDMPAHVKNALFGCSVTIPVTKGRPSLGTWQGLWLAEHRNHGGPRTVIVTVQGSSE
eukprot:ANDGO_02360.mRNA.1 UPF0047 protein YjbQ